MNLTQATGVKSFRASGRNWHKIPVQARLGPSILYWDCTGGYSCLNTERLFSKQFKYIEIFLILKTCDPEFTALLLVTTETAR